MVQMTTCIRKGWFVVENPHNDHLILHFPQLHWALKHVLVYCFGLKAANRQFTFTALSKADPADICSVEKLS